MLWACHLQLPHKTQGRSLQTVGSQCCSNTNHIFAGWPVVMKVVAPAPQSWGHILWHFCFFLQLQCPCAYQQEVLPDPRSSPLQSQRGSHPWCWYTRGQRTWVSLTRRTSHFTGQQMPLGHRGGVGMYWPRPHTGCCYSWRGEHPSLHAELSWGAPDAFVPQVPGRAASHVSVCLGTPDGTSSSLHHYFLSIPGDP